MAKPILDPAYWAKRLSEAPEDALHHAVYLCDKGKWERMANRHRKILRQHIELDDNILDAGCGWGRLLDMLPFGWMGWYRGVDLSPNFIDIATRTYADRDNACFAVDNLINIKFDERPEATKFDWAICISMRPMIRGNLGEAYWMQIQTQLLTGCDKILLLEYDENDPGEVIHG